VTWLRSDEVAVALGVTKAHVYVIAHRNSWITAKWGKQRFYSLANVEKFLAKKEKK